MIAVDRIAFAPLIPAWALAALAVAFCAALAFYAWRGGRGPVLKLAAAALVFAALAQPMWVREAREPARDIAAVVIDQSRSLAAAGRLDAARALGERLARDLGEAGLDVRVREVRGDADGTPLVAGLEDALADAPRERIAGAVLVTDGQVSDAPAEPNRLRALGPVHVLVVGDPERGDRRLELLSAPAFGLIDQPLEVEAIVHEDGGADGVAAVRALQNGLVVREMAVPLNRPFRLTLPPPKRGANLVLLEAEAGRQEITLDNNRAAFTLAGVRDRLRVLLVTGEPYPGARVWRNLLKGDPAVDLVHFTILRPPEKLDDTPISELALIEFPTRELFVEKLDRFDLIIFDRYRERGILPLAYFENVARRVEAGGALLIVAGPYDAGENSLFRTPLAAILPSRPDGAVLEQQFRPTPTALGQRHPVVRALPDPARWGRWERLTAAAAGGGETVLADPAGRPVLVLDRAGEGRVAQLWSDQVWLWARGYDGGGPHGELLRRLAHWLMQEPELDEERLELAATAEGLEIERATLGAGDPGPVTLTGPDGTQRMERLSPAGPGLWRGVARAPAAGVWRAESGALTAFAAVGPVAERETAALAADLGPLRPLAQATGGAALAVGEAGETAPAVRRIRDLTRDLAGPLRALGAAHGPGWIGFARRDGYVVRSTAAEPIAPGWAWAAAALGLFMLGWRREAG